MIMMKIKLLFIETIGVISKLNVNSRNIHTEII